MNDYQKEQLDTLQMVRDGLKRLDVKRRETLIEEIQDYLRFRRKVDDFLDLYFKELCSATCFQSRTSACCSKDGIITFFADTVVNALQSTEKELDRMELVLGGNNTGHRCVYLSHHGCTWTVRPVVCAMFLCDRAMDAVFSKNPVARKVWESFRQQEKTFKWPDRPVLFDHLEQVFLDLDCRSTLMHLHLSPGLLNVKKKAGLIPDARR